MILPVINNMPDHNMTQPHGAPGRPTSAFPTATPFPFSANPQWGPDDIGTLVFGCVASIMGILTLWLGRRRALRVLGYGGCPCMEYDTFTN